MYFPICQICKEPISNFICIDCLALGFKKHLPDKSSKKFLKFHNNISEIFRANGNAFEKCLICGISSAAPICIDCYMGEIYLSFKDDDVIKEIRKIFDFDFEEHEMIMKHEIRPITVTYIGDMEESGICDECGEFSEELKPVNGKWMCKDCTEIGSII